MPNTVRDPDLYVLEIVAICERNGVNTDALRKEWRSLGYIAPEQRDIDGWLIIVRWCARTLGRVDNAWKKQVSDLVEDRKTL